MQLANDFFTSILLYNTLLSLVMGAVIGFVVRFLLVRSRRRGWVDEDSMLVFSLAASLSSVSLVDEAFLTSRSLMTSIDARHET